MIRTFADQDMRDERFYRQSAFNQMRRSWHLDYAVSAGAAGVFGAYSYDHAQLRRDDVQPLAAILADFMHLITAAGTVEALWFNELFDPGEMVRQIADVTFDHRAFTLGSLLRHWRGVAGYLNLGYGGLKVFKDQLEFILVQLLGLVAVERLSKLLDQHLLPLGDLDQPLDRGGDVRRQGIQINVL